MTFRARILERMAGKAGTFIEHSGPRVAAALEQRQRLVAGRQLVMASNAGIRGVAGRTGFAIDCRELPVQIVLPAGRMRCRTHHQVASVALVPGGARRSEGVGVGSRQHVGVADEAFRPRRRRLFLVVNPEAFGMKFGFDIAGVASGSGARFRINVAGLAVCHPEIRRNRFVTVMTGNAIHHFRQRQRLQAGALRYRVVAGGAVQVILFAVLEVGDVRELQIDELTGDNMRSNHSPLLGKSGVLDLLRSVAAATIRRSGIGAEHRLHRLFGVAGATLRVAGESREGALWIEFMAESAVRAESGPGINAPKRINMLIMRKFEQNRPGFLVTREWKHVILSGWRKRRVALRADLLIQILVKCIGMATHALLVPRALQFD